MSYSEIIYHCQRGKIGIIPNWKGYLKWNYSSNELQFINGDYIMFQKELEDKIKNRTDLYYII